MWDVLLPLAAIWLGGLTFFLVLAVWDQMTPMTPKPTPTYCPMCRCIQDEHREPARWWKRNRIRRLGMPQVCKHHLRALQLCYPVDADMARTVSGFMRYAGRIIDA